MVKTYNMEQGTKEWFDIRKLHFTASNANTILACGKGLETLIETLLIEHYSSNNYEEFSSRYQNKQMVRGKEFEDKARTIYELETGYKIEQVGFIELDENIGCSPDGLIGDDGLIEIKNHNDKKFFELITTGKIEKKYLDQMQMQMFVTGRKWCDYFGFNPNWEKPFFIKRIYRDESVMTNLSRCLVSAKRKLHIEKDKVDKLIA